jgi:hypothetical protein
VALKKFDEGLSDLLKKWIKSSSSTLLKAREVQKGVSLNYSEEREGEREGERLQQSSVFFKQIQGLPLSLSLSPSLSLSLFLPLSQRHCCMGPLAISAAPKSMITTAPTHTHTHTHTLSSLWHTLTRTFTRKHRAQQELPQCPCKFTTSKKSEATFLFNFFPFPSFLFISKRFCY